MFLGPRGPRWRRCGELERLGNRHENAINGAAKVMWDRSGWPGTDRQVLRFRFVRATGSAQLNWHSTIATISRCAREGSARTALLGVCAVLAVREAEMIGEWLVKYHRNRQPWREQRRRCRHLTGGAENATIPVQSLGTHTARNSKATINGYTIKLMALTITCSPQRTTASKPRINTNARMARGGNNGICSWCSMKLLTVLVSFPL